jgi:hypothetical protein
MLTAILSLTPLSGNLAIESAVANMLAAQGDRILFVTCDGQHPRCILDNFFKADIDRVDACSVCSAGAKDYLQQLGLHAANYADLDSLVDPAERDAAWAAIDGLDDEAVLTYEYAGLPMQERIIDGLRLAYYGENYRLLPNLPQVTRDMLKSLVYMAMATHALIDRYHPDSILLLNGLISNESVVWDVGRQRGVHTILYEGGQRPGTVFFDDRSPACAYDVSDAWAHWRHVPLSRAEAGEVETMMVRRIYQRGGGYVYSPSSTGRKSEVLTELGLPPDKPLLVAYTNCSADTSVFRSNEVFPQQIDWILATIDYVAARPDVALAIRIHPVEGTSHTFREGKIVGVRDKIADGIAERWPELPDNVRIVSFDAAISSYDLMQQAHVVLAYVSTVGIEAATLGKAVLNAGIYHYTDKGFTYRPDTSAEYVTMLDRLIADPTPLPQAQELAARYMHLWMFRSMIMVPALQVDPVSQATALHVLPISDYGRGRCAEYDQIVDYLHQLRPLIDRPAAWRPCDDGIAKPLRFCRNAAVLGMPTWDRLDEFARGLLQLPAGTEVTILADRIAPDEAAQRIIAALSPLAEPAVWPELDVVPSDLTDQALGGLLVGVQAVLTSRRPASTDRVAAMARHVGVPVISMSDTAALKQLYKGLHTPAPAALPN